MGCMGSKSSKIRNWWFQNSLMFCGSISENGFCGYDNIEPIIINSLCHPWLRVIIKCIKFSLCSIRGREKLHVCTITNCHNMSSFYEEAPWTWILINNNEPISIHIPHQTIFNHLDLIVVCLFMINKHKNEFVLLYISNYLILKWNLGPVFIHFIIFPLSLKFEFKNAPFSS